MSNAYRLVKSIHTRWEPAEGEDLRSKGGKRPGKHVTYIAGASPDIMHDLSPAEIRRLGNRIVQVSGLTVPIHVETPVAPPATAPVVETPAEPAADLSDLPWQTLKARVAEMSDPAEVRAVFSAEKGRDKPRQAILEACRVRLEELVD